MDQFDVVLGEFRPRCTDDLVTGAARWIGRLAKWEALWVIEGGPYNGEWAMAPRGEPGWPFAWAPSGDIVPS